MVIQEPEAVLNETVYVQGHIRVRVSESFAKELETQTTDGEVSTKALSNELVSSLEITSLKRTFANGGRFEERRRKMGLHLWYDIIFNENVSLTKAGKDISDFEGVEDIEYRPKIKFMRGEMIPASKSITQLAESTMPFNDPYLNRQWNLYNDGSIENTTTGSDINVFDTWKNNITGSNDVIVAVVDGGIDYDHEDLANNMWINEAEKNGTRGIDDDGNGYRDDIYGYNFTRNSGTISKDDHGTHVAGIIGAVNNNGKGICGIAGGDGTGNGVRLMSCVIISNRSPNSSTITLDAMAYAADNGAVICQNSWGYDDITEIPASDKLAIDYFIEYAGVDEHGVQTGPMKGGIVLFAAGNENVEEGAMVKYDKVIGVSAMDANYKRASYSNYGSWIDMIAPGGDDPKVETYILSTITENQYAYINGTSMACPHVSGVAALVVSRFGGMGFTAGKLREILINSAIDIDQYNPDMRGKLGKLVNAAGAIDNTSTIAPEQVENITGDAASNNINLEWIIPSDADDGKTAKFNIYYRKTSFSTATIHNIPQDVVLSTVFTRNLQAGEKIRTTISSLDFETKYYIRISALDYSNNSSPLSKEITVTTPKNNPPVITALNGTSVSMKSHESKTLSFRIQEPDSHAYTWSFEKGTLSVLVSESAGTVNIQINGLDSTPGTYNCTLQAKDEYNASTSLGITIIILSNNPPEVSNPINNILISDLNSSQTVTLNEHFKDADDEILNYTMSSDGQIANIGISNGVLTISPSSYGLVDVQVSASDARNETASTSFKLLIRDGSKEVDIYPNPVVKDLYIRTGTEKEYTIKLQNSAGVTALETTQTITPFTPLALDMSTLPGGTYTIFVNGVKNPQIIMKH